MNMSKNIEIKAHCNDFDFFSKKLSELPYRYEGLDVQMDTFYYTPSGRLKLRESSLYGTFLIPYVRSDQEGPKESDYALIELKDPDKVKELLALILGKRIVVKKKRQIYIYQNIRIHFDEVENLGSFIELEAVIKNEDELDANQTKVEQLTAFFGVKQEDLIAEAYADMLQQ